MDDKDPEEIIEIAEIAQNQGVDMDSAEKIKEVMDYNGPVICDVMTPEWQLIIPRISSEKKPDGTLISKPYEDMFPFLDRKEFLSNMIIEPLKESKI